MTTLSTEVLVIGGGATGVGVAWDATLRGFEVILVDRADLAEGTSGRFHGLLHSGGRYAVKDPRAAEECIAENRILRRVAADCIEDTGGLFVTTPFDDPAYADTFVEGCGATGVDCEEIDVAEALRSEPRVSPKISRAFRVPDANIDVWKTVWAMSHGAQQRGARILTYHEAIAIHRSADRVTGARVRNANTGEEIEIEARGHRQRQRRLGRPGRRHGRNRGRAGAARPGDHDRDEPPAGEHGHQPLPDADRRRHPRADPHRVGDRHDRPAHRRPRRPHRPRGRGRPDVRRRREARARASGRRARCASGPACGRCSRTRRRRTPTPAT